MTQPAVEHSILKVISADGVTIPNPLATVGAQRLAVILPGRGYTIHHPLLHYVTKILLKQRWDVLRVQYAFQLGGGALQPQQLPTIYEDAQSAVAQALARGGYERVLWVGKSMGTPLAAQLAQAYPEQTRGLLLLTPIQQVAASVAAGTPTLAVIGTADPYYDAEHVAATQARVQWLVLEALDHALEVAGDWRGSLQALERVLASCERFIEALA